MSKNLNQRHRALFDLIMSLSRQLRCCSRDEAICQNVTFHQFVILDAVVQSGRLDLAQLHDILGVEKSTTTRLVNPLIRKGLLQRGRAAHDSRAVILTLTDEGIETHREVWSCMEDFFENIDRHLPPEKREETLDAVGSFARAMGQAAVTCRVVSNLEVGK